MTPSHEVPGRDDPEFRWRRWMEVVLATASEPAVVDMAEHLLYLGTTPQP